MTNPTITSSPSEVLEISRPRDGVVQLTLNRPRRLNALNAELVGALHSALDDIAVDPDARVVVLTGAGKGFCGGGDLAGYGALAHAHHLGPIQQGLAVQRHIASLIPHLRSIPQPVIAAVHGAAAGGGLSLLLGSDIRLAARSARFNVAYIRVGLSGCDIGTSWLLPRLVGVARAQELMLTGRTVDAEEALRIGLVIEVHDDDELLDAAYRKAQEVVANSPFGVAMTKEGMWTALETPGLQASIDFENRQQLMFATTEDLQESRRALAEQRAPRWTNR